MSNQQESRFYKYLLPVISALSTTVITASVAVYVAKAGNALSSAQLKMSQESASAQLQLAREAQDRQWKVDAGKFVIEHQNDILKGSRERKTQFGRIAAIAFPPE